MISRANLAKAFLVGQQLVDRVQPVAAMILDETAPQLHDVVGPLGQIASGGQLPDQIPGGDRQRGIGRRADLVIPLAAGLVGDLGVDVASRAGHMAGAHSLDAGGLHRVEQIAGHLALRHIAGRGGGVVILVAERKGIGGAPGEQDLVAGHPAADLRQADGVGGLARRIDAEGHRKVGVVGHDLGGLGEGLLERIGGVVAWLAHGPDKAPVAGRGKRRRRARA
jgi:hypothetical protein